LPPGTSGQQLSELYVHALNTGKAELWAKIEFQPWFGAFKGAADQDRDGYPEVYGRLQTELATPALLAEIRDDYLAKVLSPAEIKAWANQLSSYWYPSFNTDLVPAGATWPDEQTEADIKAELGTRSFARPTLVLRGKPQGKPTYNVLLISGEAAAAATPGASQLALKKTRPSPDPQPLIEQLRSELQREGKGDYAAWQASLSPFHSYCRTRLKAMPPKAKALAGRDGFLFYKMASRTSWAGISRSNVTVRTRCR
jgi:alginate O-acetyltransferase complex protein AlgJ